MGRIKGTVHPKIQKYTCFNFPVGLFIHLECFAVRSAVGGMLAMEMSEAPKHETCKCSTAMSNVLHVGTHFFQSHHICQLYHCTGGNMH